MSRIFSVRSACAFVVTMLLSAAAHAQLFRAYLDSHGSDANPCTLPAPCRLLPAALAAVANGGEIWMLDSANFNNATVTIGKSVSILAIPGAVGSVVAIGGPAIDISASGLTISLRNMVIVPFPSSGATYGVYMTGASKLTIENSLIANFPQDAVHIVGTGNVAITNTTIRNNEWAVWVQDGASADISSTKLLNNYGGVVAASSTATRTTVTVSDTIISLGTYGVFCYSTVAGGDSRVFVTRSTIQKNTQAALHAGANVGSALIAVSSSMITNNYYGWTLTGTNSILRTLGNNHLVDNNFASGPLTPAALQ